MEAIGSDPPGYCPTSLSWQKMFQQLKDYHDRGQSKGRIPPRIIRWMSTQQRQYRVYGIGLKEPVGIIKHRVKKLNELGFEWNPSLDSEPMSSVEHDRYLEELEAEEMARTRNKWSGHRKDSSIRTRNYGIAKTKNRDTPAARDGQKQNPLVNEKKREEPASGSVKGITRRGPGRRWEVRAKVNGERKYVGSFDTHQEAVEFLAAHNKKQKANAIATKRPKESKKWHVHLNLNDDKLYIGSFGTHAEATKALREAKEKHKMPEHPVTTKGITKSGRKKKWEVRVNVDGEQRYIGSYKTEADAIEAQERYKQQLNVKSSPTKKNHPRGQEASNPTESTSSKPAPSRSERHRMQGNDQEFATVNDQEFATVNEEQTQPRKPPRDRSKPPPSKRKLEPDNSPKKRSTQSSSSKKKHLNIKGITHRNDNGKWEVRYHHEGKRKYAGRYDSRAEAIKILRETRLKYNIEDKIGLPEESREQEEQQDTPDASESDENQNESADERSEKDEADLDAEEGMDAERKGQEQDEVTSDESGSVEEESERNANAWTFVNSDEENDEDTGAKQETNKATTNTDPGEDAYHENSEVTQTESPAKVPRKPPRDRSTTPSSSKKAKSRKSPKCSTPPSSSEKKHIGCIKGISQRRDNGKWEVRYHHEGKRKYAGRFDNKADAVRALREIQEEYDIQDVDGLEEAEDATKGSENDDQKNDDQNGEDVDDASANEDVNEMEDSSDDDGEEQSFVPSHSYFPQIVFQMVNESSVATPEILEWLPCGSAFKVNDYDRIGEVISRHFKRKLLVSSLPTQSASKSRI